MDYKPKLRDLLLLTVEQNASDFHIGVGFRPALRIDGTLVPLAKEPIVNPETAEGLVTALLTPEQKEIFLQKKQLDLAYAFEDKARFRVNVFFQRGYMAAALRLIPSKIKTVDELNLP